MSCEVLRAAVLETEDVDVMCCGGLCLTPCDVVCGYIFPGNTLYTYSGYKNKTNNIKKKKKTVFYC